MTSESRCLYVKGEGVFSQGNAGRPQVSLPPTGGGLGAVQPWGRSVRSSRGLRRIKPTVATVSALCFTAFAEPDGRRGLGGNAPAAGAEPAAERTSGRGKGSASHRHVQSAQLPVLRKAAAHSVSVHGQRRLCGAADRDHQPHPGHRIRWQADDGRPTGSAVRHPACADSVVFRAQRQRDRRAHHRGADGGFLRRLHRPRAERKCAGAQGQAGRGLSADRSERSERSERDLSRLGDKSPLCKTGNHIPP